ncbi:MAG TPA: hypothetical protein VGX03_11325 [Candidatus Binatia bacterium]|jgi:hypothetical protein|nr:hypothetical protein [Candidatus Binatia bacterium]
MTLYLDEPQIRALLRMEELIPAMERALIAFSAGQVVQPVRSGIAVNPPGGFFFLMPALAGGLGVKIVTFYPTNAERGLPTQRNQATSFSLGHRSTRNSVKHWRERCCRGPRKLRCSSRWGWRLRTSVRQQWSIV